MRHDHPRPYPRQLPVARPLARASGSAYASSSSSPAHSILQKCFPSPIVHLACCAPRCAHRAPQAAPHLLLGPPLQRGGAPARVQALPAGAAATFSGSLPSRNPCSTQGLTALSTRLRSSSVFSDAHALDINPNGLRSVPNSTRSGTYSQSHPSWPEHRLST